jgi:hypothetical protein
MEELSQSFWRDEAKSGVGAGGVAKRVLHSFNSFAQSRKPNFKSV